MKMKRRLSGDTKRSLYGWIFVAPFVLGVLGFYGRIWLDSVIYSLSDIVISTNRIALTFNGFKNYYHILRVDPYYITELTASVRSMFFEIPTLLIFSLFIAVLLNQRMVGRAFFRAIFFMPVILCTGFIEKADILTQMHAALSSSAGVDSGSSLSGALIQAMDIRIYLANMNFGSGAIDFVLSLVNGIFTVVTKSGVQILVFLAGLQSISPSVYESAQIEGASAWECFWKITFPMIGPYMMANALYSVIDSFTRTSNGIMSLIQTTAFSHSNYGWAAAMSWTYSIVIIAFLAVVGGICYKLFFSDSRKGG